jgi:hypothetical protein
MHAPPIIANVMKQDQDSLGRKLTAEYIIQVIKYQLVLFKVAPYTFHHWGTGT